MRGRSHRLQSADPHEDWVDGSWTVDCVCGVTFDDGEEMVNCDECGVWVHTRCSKYVKGEELFACDKCKTKSNRNGNGSHHNDSEETEVAQLLVELPTKTVRIEGSFNETARQPVRLWTEIPMESRVHEQGIPGGDPELFSGLSSVFTPELWKCTGYVPKKFNFQYKEFPCWGEKENGNKKQEEHEENQEGHEENENADDKGAGMLFSLSKETALATPVAALVRNGGREEEHGFGRKVHSKEMKTWENDGVDFRRSQNGAKKERSLLRPVVVYSGKRKKEDLGTSKDWSGKKKARSAEKEVDDRKRGLHASRTVFRPTSDAKPFQFYEDRGAKSSKTDMQSVKNKNSWEDVHQEPVSDGYLAVDNGVDKHSNNLADNEHPPEALSSDISKHNFSNEAGMKEELAGHHLPAVMKSPPKTDNAMGSLSEPNDAKSIAVKVEGDSVAIDKLGDSVEGSAKSALKPLVQDMVAPEVVDKHIDTDFIGYVSQSSVMPNLEVKIEADNENSRGNLNFQSSSADAEVQPKCNSYINEISEANDIVASSSQSSDHKAQDAEKTSVAVSNCHTEKAHVVTGDACLIKGQVEGSASAVEVQKTLSESKHGSWFAEEQSKSERTSLNSPALLSQRKMVVCVGKSSSTSSNALISKSSAPDNFESSDTQNSNLNIKQKVISDSNSSVQKDHVQSDVVRDDEKHDILRKTTKEHSRSSVTSVSKMSHPSRISHATVLKRTMSDSKDSVPSSSSKPSSMQNVAVTSGSGESAGSLLNQCALPGKNKMSTSGLPVKGEKLNQSNFQSSKLNHAPLMHPPAASNSPATLSDEELALLLHQELNSSPRVPRVPRMRHAGSLPQMTSPTATSMLIKRTSSSGGKDHNLGSRRKNKDASKDGSRGNKDPSKDGSRGSCDLDDEVRRTDRVPSSPDLRRQDGAYTVDTDTKREDNGSPTTVYSVKKNMPSVSANSGPSSSTEANDHVSAVRHSPRNISDDDTGTIRTPVHRTLPGLINEIMSKGRRMAYEELCNAVLPHWPHLRKHNGERYAYSSHSQAVLDCLRNRHEWARLVDRGPKTNSSKKRRKHDADESEDNEYDDGRTVKEVECKSLESRKEEFPKGKRKARKRRRLVLQGRGIKDVRKRRKADLLTDDEDPISNSSEESTYSEDETHAGGACPAASEASASSDEAGTA